MKHIALFVPLALAFACEPATNIGPATSPQTSRLQISKDGKTLYVALADHGLVRAVDAASGRITGEVKVDGYPHRLTVLDDGRVAVTARDAGTLSIVDVEQGRVEAKTFVGAQPYGVVQSGDDLFVAVGGEADLARISLKNPTRVASRIELGHADPRGLAKLDDGKIVVSHFSAGVLSVVDGSSGDVVSTIDMKLPSKKFFFPNQMESVTASLDGQVAVPHVECNNDPAQFGANGTSLAGAAPPAVTYYVDGPTGYPAVVPAISHVDPEQGVLLSDENRTLEEASGSTPERSGPAAPVINPLNRNLLGQENLNGVTEVAWVDGGKLQLVVARGTGNVFVRRPNLLDGEKSIAGAVKLDVGAEAIQISPDGATAYVYNSFDDTIASFPVPHENVAASKFAAGTSDVYDPTTIDQTTGQEIRSLVVDKPTSKFTVAEPVLDPAVRAGRVLFYAADDRLTHDGAIACQSCHPNGAADGTTWHFDEGPRNSPALWGGITDTAPFHWDNSVADMSGISDATIVRRMGGAGLDAHDMNKIGAFLDSIPVPTSPAEDPASVARGSAVFASSGCMACHAGARFSDNATHDIGTGRGEAGGVTSFATPVLRGVAYTAPYLHDGSAATLRDVIDRLVATDMMGHGSQLTEQDKNDLVTYLRTL